MKIKRIIATTLCAVTMFSAAGCFVACGSDESVQTGLGTTDSVNLADYYSDLTAEENELKNELVRLNSDNESIVSYSDQYAVIRGSGSDAEYTVYYVQTGEKKTNIKYAPTVGTYDFLNGWSSYFYAIRYTKYDSSNKSRYSYCAPDGTVLLDYDYYSDSNYYNTIRFARLIRYVGNSSTPSYVLRVSATVTNYSSGGSDSVVSYFEIDSGDKTYPEYSTTPSYIPRDENELSEQPLDYSSDTAVGGIPALSSISYTSSGADSYVGGEIAKYKYTKLGSSYYFYKNNNKTGSVSVVDGQSLGFLGDNFYYYTVTPVSPDSQSYNTVVHADSATVKAEYRLYRYSIVNNALTEYDPDFMVLAISPMYNKRKGAYDAATVTGVKRMGGVFYLMSQSSGSVLSDVDSERLITDGDLRVAYNLSDMSGDFSKGYKLSNDRYYLPNVYGGIITDKSLNYICKAVTVFDNVKRIGFIGTNGKRGLLSYDGKIAVAAEYETIGEFYGGMAFCTRTDNGAEQKVLIDADGNETVLPESAVTIGNGNYTVTKLLSTRYVTEIYNYAGVMLKSFSNLSYAPTVAVKYPFVKSGDELYMFK